MIERFLLCSTFFIGKRLFRYLRYFQQEEYDSKRFLQWIRESQAWDRRGTAVCLSTWILSFWNPALAFGLGSLTLLLLSFIETNPLKEGKLRLRMTARAQRIYGVAILNVILTQMALYFLLPWQWEIMVIQFTPLSLVLASGALAFDENRRQQNFLLEAKEQLAKVSPYVIGITGSYGKTSTKDALGNLLQVTLGPTFWPAKGINTPMGITREVRSNLFPETKYGVIEMGAYGSGSIRRLCQLTPPNAAIITGTGVAHLERFGSEETIRLAKAELADAVPDNGILVCNGDNAGACRIAEEHRKKQTYLYGFDQNADCRISHYETTPEGTLFTFEWEGQAYSGRTQLFGKPALSNIAAAFTMACALGAQPEFVIAAIQNLEPVNNRLQIQKENGKIFLNDAYNSNPTGFGSALDVLSDFPANRRFLMTPGMIELGELNETLHRKLGQHAGKVCDFAIVVGETNREALTKGLTEAGMSSREILCVSTRDEAFRELDERLREGDAVLIENDLTDLYEVQETF